LAQPRWRIFVGRSAAPPPLRSEHPHDPLRPRPARPDRLQPAAPLPGIQRHPAERHRPRAGPSGTGHGNSRGLGRGDHLPAGSRPGDRTRHRLGSLAVLRRDRSAAGGDRLGQAEGRSVAEMEARYTGRSFPGREDLHSVVDRACSALDELADARPGQSVLLVAHGTLIRLLISGVTGEHLPSLPNGALSLLEVEDDTWTVHVISGRQIEPISAALPRDHRPRFTLDDDHLTPYVPTLTH